MKTKGEKMRIDVVLLAIALCVLIMLPGLLIGLSTNNYIIIALNTMISLLLTILIMNKFLTGKWTNGKKLWFD